jgi:hypothetical protein
LYPPTVSTKNPDRTGYFTNWHKAVKTGIVADVANAIGYSEDADVFDL